MAKSWGYGSHYRLWAHFRKRYGTEATSLVRQSLARSLLADYQGKPGYPALLRWVWDNRDDLESAMGYRSQALEDHYSRYEVVHDTRLINLVVDDREPESEGLRLPLFAWFAQCLALIIGGLVAENLTT